MKTLSISEARNNFTSVISDISHTHEMVVIERYGKPVVTIIPFKTESTSENLHPLRGIQISISDNFDEPQPELWKELAVAEESVPYTTKTDKPEKNNNS